MSHIINKDDWNSSFWKHDYIVSVTSQGIRFAVNADNAQDAIDEIIDYCESNLPGLIFSREEEADEEYLEEFIHGGNHGRYLNTRNIHFETIR